MKFYHVFLIIIILSQIICKYKYLGVERYGTIKRNEVLNKDSQIYRFIYN